MRLWLTLTAATLTAATVGCRTGARTLNVAGGETVLSAASSADFLDRLSDKTDVTHAEAVQGVRLLLGESQDTTFAAAVASMAERGIVPRTWTFDAGGTTTRGQAAYMIHQACRLRGGLTLTLTGPSRRYCLRELQYRGLMTEGVGYNAISGMEFVAVLARADELRQTGGVSDVVRNEGEIAP